jgi:D-alanyl-D-alanine dipeptidase
VIPFVLFSAFVAFVAFGKVAAPAQQPANALFGAADQPAQASWEDVLWLPAQNLFKSLFESTPVATRSARAPVSTATAFEAAPGCSVAPLKPIDEASAQQLEANTGSNIVDVADMIPAAARALNRFESNVASVGGTMTLKSAYRPAAYQKHLQDVWYKWMGELKDNHGPACQVLRTLVQEEFVRHRLIETQHPVAASDHTRGLAFDATVDLPATAKVGRRLTLDRLARLAGLLRPAIAADPVHFKFLVGGAPRYLALRRRHFNG